MHPGTRGPEDVGSGMSQAAIDDEQRGDRRRSAQPREGP